LDLALHIVKLPNLSRKPAGKLTTFFRGEDVMKGNSGRKLMALILFLVLPTALLAPLSVRSATADTVLSTVTVGSGPLAVAVNPVTNKIYTVNNDNVRYAMTVIDGATNSTATVGVGTDPGAIAVNPVTNKIYVVNTNLYFTNSNNGGHTGSVTVIDGADNSSATVDAGILPCAIAVNPATNKIYIANRDSNTVTVIDGATDSTTTVSVGTGPDAVAVNPVTNKIYVANSNGGHTGSVTVIDGADNSSATVNAGSYPLAIAVNSATNKVYVVNNSNAYGEYTTGTVTVIDGATNQTVTVTVGLNPFALAVNPATNKIYVVNNSDDGDTVTVIDGATNSTATINVGPDPGAIAVNPVSNKIYVVNCGQGPGDTSPNWDGTVTVIDGTDNSTTTVPLGLHPDAVAVNPFTGQAYVANEGDNTVTVIDGAAASEVQKSISFTVGQNSYTANGQSLAMDAAPLIAGGRLLAPVRYLADALGAQTTWDATRRTVSILRGNTALELAIGSAALNDNGRVGWMDTAPVIINGRTYFPIRYIAEAFGYTVSWDASSQTVTVSQGN
jgi:YVTN family beta-propeller protein